MTITIKKYQAEKQFIKALIYGASGSWKTTFSATAPNLIFASSEKWLMSIRHLSPDYAEINSLQDLKDLYNFLKNEKHGFETCIIDSITELNDIIKTEIETKNKRNMQLQDWGILQKEIKDILRKFRDLPMHIIFLAQETTEKDEEKIVKYLPSLNGKSATEIAYYMDTVGYCFIDKLGNRKIATTPNERFLTKDRTNVIEGGENQNFTEWVNAVKSGVEIEKTKPIEKPKTETKTSTKKDTKPTKKAETERPAEVVEKPQESEKSAEKVIEIRPWVTKTISSQTEENTENEFVTKLAEKPLENIEKEQKIKDTKNTVDEVFASAMSFATDYQISTIVGLVKKLAGSIPYAEQVHKLQKTIVAVCGIEIVKENEEWLEEICGKLNIEQASDLITYLKSKLPTE